MSVIEKYYTVNDWKDILKNFIALESNKYSKDESERSFYLSLIKKGNCFVVCQINRSTVFAPSRFIGYLNNTKSTHEASTIKDGRVTNPIIEGILEDKFTENPSLESIYKGYCYSLGIIPNQKGTFGKPRKYILYANADSNSNLIDDINEIINNNTISVTEKKNLISTRIGQGHFRNSLINLWKGCSITGCKEISILKASHIKPWRDSNNEERLNIFNGLLLIPNLDALFDKGLISFQEDGKILISHKLDQYTLKILDIRKSYKIKVFPEMLDFLKYHRDNIYQK
ncbi:MAG: HNH endonuclease signature motif containing protein [Bacteroidota bacterium]|nr:HNH endonuclease signature motif containing protein [Bacteroidota bacterium]